MSKREDIDQLKHDCFMLAGRIESLEQRMKKLIDDSARTKPAQEFRELTFVPMEEWKGGSVEKAQGYKVPGIDAGY